MGALAGDQKADFDQGMHVCLMDCRALLKYRQEKSAGQQEADKPEPTNGKAPPPPPSNDPSRHPSQSQPSSYHTQSKSRSKSLPHQRSDSTPQTQSKPESHDQHVDCNGGVHSTHLDKSDEGLSQEMADTLSRIHTPNAADDRGLTGSPEQSPHQSPAASSSASPQDSPEASSHQRDSHVVDMPQDERHMLPPHSCSASSVHGGSPSPAKCRQKTQPASAKKVDVQDLKDMEEGSQRTDTQTGGKKNRDGQESQHSRASSHRKLNQDEFFERDFMLAPSSYACEYDPDISPDKLADIYTGGCDCTAFDAQLQQSYLACLQCV